MNDPNQEAETVKLPSYPDDEAATDQRPATAGRRGTAIFIAILAVLFIVMMILHLSGAVGPGAH